MESFINTWQYLPYHIKPYLFSIGTFQLRYYSLMYIVGIAIVYFVTVYRIKNEKYEYSVEMLQDYLIWAMIAMILGARLGEVFFYNFSYYLQHPLEIFLPFSFTDGVRFTGISGMSYHGGIIAIILVSIFYLRK